MPPRELLWGVVPSHLPHHGVLKIEGNGGLGDYELDQGYLRGDYVTGWIGFDASPTGYFPDIDVSLGQTGAFRAASAAAEEARRSLPEVGSGYVFVRGEGFVEVRNAPFFADEPPMDWEAVRAHNEQTSVPIPEPFVPANVPVIDPDFNPTGTEAETSAGHPVEEVPVSFWEDVGDVFTTTLPGAINAYGTGQGWWGTPAQAPSAVYSPVATLTTPGFPSGPGAAAYTATPSSNVVPIVQDQALCAVPAAQPRYLRYNCQTGQFSKVPRRRRRRLLTSSDLKDLAALKAIVGGGAKMDGAIVQAIRR